VDRSGKVGWWRELETRPYMRARAARARARWAAGLREEAVAELGELMRLNPGDNQGLRYWLGPWLVESGKLPAAEMLRRAFGQDGRADALYLAALLAFAREGGTAYAVRVLAEALAENPLVPDFLLGKRRLPKALPEMAGAGDEHEATACAMIQGGAWRSVPDALAWLKRLVG
jgi:predicted Zn-dependent protease